MGKQIEILDTTLRDGAQARGISLSVDDKLNIAASLDMLGISYIEFGNPATGERELEGFRRVRRHSLETSRVAAFGATRRKNTPVAEDAGVRALEASGADTIVIFGKSWDLHVDHVLGTTKEENLAMIADTVAHFAARGCHVIYDAEHYFDGRRSDHDYALETLRTAVQAGAHCITLCDTNGGTMPNEIYEATREAKELLRVQIGIHCHDDCGLAVAGTLEAVRAGATLVQGTLLGFGERCGNAKLTTILPNLQLKLGYDCIPEKNMPMLTTIARQVAEIANISIPSYSPYIGSNAFTHKAGMHADGVLKLSRTFEHVSPEDVGNMRRILTSEMSGRNALYHKIQRIAPELDRDSPEIQRIIEKLKEAEQNGYTFEAAEASFELMVRRETGRMPNFFDLIFYKTIGEQPFSSTMSSSAVVKLRVGDREAVNAAEGEGPVHALDTALRKTLDEFYPRLAESYLCDFKVRVLNPEAATAAKVRVLMTSTDGDATWSTVGVSSDILEASWTALSEAVEYKLIRDAKL